MPDSSETEELRKRLRAVKDRIIARTNNTDEAIADTIAALDEASEKLLSLELIAYENSMGDDL